MWELFRKMSSFVQMRKIHLSSNYKEWFRCYFNDNQQTNIPQNLYTGHTQYRSCGTFSSGATTLLLIHTIYNIKYCKVWTPMKIWEIWQVLPWISFKICCCFAVKRKLASMVWLVWWTPSIGRKVGIPRGILPHVQTGYWESRRPVSSRLLEI